MDKHKNNQHEALIEALYDLALTPNNFESFNLAWEQYLLEYPLSEQLSNQNNELSNKLTRHFSRAFDILEKIGRGPLAKTQSLEQFIAARETPAIALDSTGRLIALNRDASEILQAKSNTQFASELIHQKSADSLLKGLRQTLDNTTPFPVIILLPNGQPALMLMQRFIDSETVIIDISGASWNDYAERTLRSAYKLTDRECEIAADLFHGLSINEIAEQQHRTVNTVRKHTKSLLKKTQTHSQPKLMRLLTSLNFTGDDRADIRWENSQTNNYSLTLNDGRKLAYYDSGGSNKKVIAVVHGVLHDPELPPVMHERLIANGYRIIGISRAWFGDSSAGPEHKDILHTAAADLISVLDALDIETAVLLGIMAGSLHTYVASAIHPKRISHIINIAGMVSLTNETQISMMSKGVRPVAYTAKYFPKLLPLFIRTAVAMIDSGDIKKLFQSIYRESAIDMQALQNEEICERLKKGYNFANFYGHAGYTNEGIAIVKNMTRYLEMMECKVDLIHGLHDGATPTALVHDLCRQYDNFNAEIIESAGQLLLYTEPAAIADRVLTLLRH